MLVKSDGGVLYGTTDMATIVERMRDQDPDLILYVVDHRQHGHFEQLFRAARKSGIAGKAHLEHAGFGTINGPDGKPFKTRAGGVMKLYDLIAMAEVEAKSRLAEQGLGGDYSPEERDAIAKQIAIATIKFADLSNHRTTDYIFDLERFSQLRRQDRALSPICGGAHQIHPAQGALTRAIAPGTPAIHSPEERDLVLQLLSLGDAMQAAEEKRAPNILCDYAFTLAQNFSRFYAAHHILSETGRGPARPKPSGPLRPGAGGDDPDPGPSGHRGSRKNVNNFRGLRLRFDLGDPPPMMPVDRAIRREAPYPWPTT